MLNPLYTYILNIYDLVWFGFMVYQLLYSKKVLTSELQTKSTWKRSECTAAETFQVKQPSCI